MGELWFQQSKTTPGAIEHHGRSTAAALAVIVYLMCATVSGMLLFGVVKSRPSYLMPFFWIQLCDFFFSLPSFLSSLYATPGSPYVNHYQQSHSPPGGLVGKFWPHSGPSGAPSTLLISTCIILFKGYFLCVVWKCYRYLKMKEMVLPLHFPCSSPPSDLVLPPGFVPPSVLPVAISSMAPPDYETATKSQPAPPDYDTAVRNNQESKETFDAVVVEPAETSSDARALPAEEGGDQQCPRADLNKQEPSTTQQS